MENEFNIEEYLINISIALYKNYNTYNNEKMEILNKFKEYLSMIFQSDKKLRTLFNTLEYLIFQNINNKLYINKKILILYPIIFEFDIKLSYEYFDSFLLLLQKCSIVYDYQFFSYLFSELIKIFLENSLIDDKEKLYIKLLNYSINLIEYNSNIHSNNNYNLIEEEEKSIEKKDHLLGCIYLSILIDKYCFFNNEKILNDLWNLFSFYLNKKNYIYIYDILFCTLKLINVVKEKFKLYCNLCLFTILDYLIDDNWIIRKISLEIIFYLTKYCKKEILSVKENIVEFLNILKNDKVPIVKDDCIQTLNFIEGKEYKQVMIPNTNQFFFDNNNEENDFNIYKENNYRNNYIDKKFVESENEKNNSNQNIPFVNTEREQHKYNSDKENNNNILCIENYCFDNNDIHNKSYDNLYKETSLNNRNYSHDNNNKKKYEINNYQKPNKPINKICKKVKLNVPKKCPKNKINYMKYINNNPNGKKNLSVTKLSYSVIQSNENSSEELFSDNNYSIRKNNIKTSRIDINKKYTSTIKVNKNSNSKIPIYNKQKTDQSLIKKSENKNVKRIEKLNKGNINRKNLIKNKDSINFNKSTISFMNKIGNNYKSKNTISTNKSYLNLSKKYAKKINNKSHLLNSKKTEFFNKYLKKEEKNNFKFDTKKKIAKKTIINNTEINPKINLLPLFSEENKIKSKSLMNKNKTNISISNSNNSNDFSKLNEQLNTLYEGQNMIIKIINNLKDKVDDNYRNINDRLISYEGNKVKTKIKKNKIQIINNNNKKLELIKQKYNDSQFNDALLESVQNDIYLFKLLPLIKEEDLPKINIILIEDIISRLSLKMPSILRNNNRSYFGVILSFLNLVVNSNLKLKIITKLNLKDSLNFIKGDYKYFNISTIDINIIENIIKSIKK